MNFIGEAYILYIWYKIILLKIAFIVRMIILMGHHAFLSISIFFAYSINIVS